MRRCPPPLGCGACLTPDIRPFLTIIVITANLVVLCQTALVRNYRDPPEKFDPSCSAFQGHSSPGTGTDRLAA